MWSSFYIGQIWPLGLAIGRVPWDHLLGLGCANAMVVPLLGLGRVPFVGSQLRLELNVPDRRVPTQVGSVCPCPTLLSRPYDCPNFYWDSSGLSLTLFRTPWVPPN